MDWMCAKIGESSDSRNYPLAGCEDVREWAREKRPKPRLPNGIGDSTSSNQCITPMYIGPISWL